jgi:outer membrane protein assembly factor BamC
MKNKIRLIIIAAVLVNISACTYIKNLFPDKEKDYQFTTEIPPLVLPPDLSGEATAKVPAAPAAEASNTEASESAASSVSPTEIVPAIDRKSIQVELLDSEQGSKRLHIGAPVAIAWRMVGKALSRNSIEVTKRSQEDRLFHVQFEPDKLRVEDEDESFLDEIVFFFEGFEVSEQAYVLKLEGNDQQTDVIITDKDQQPATDRLSFRLMTLLQDTMKADLAK